MMERSRNLLYVTALSLVAILAVVFLSFNNSNNLEGAIIWEAELSEDYHFTCTEVEDSLNYFNVKGSVDFQEYRYYDVCYGDKLFQVHCASSVRVGMLHGYDCPNGCENGVCLS